MKVNMKISSCLEGSVIGRWRDVHVRSLRDVSEAKEDIIGYSSHPRFLLFNLINACSKV